MAKELPYFKFEPNQWDSGKIQMCSFTTKGVFIEVCSLYWNRLGELPYALALQKVCNGNADALQDLEKNEIIIINEGNIEIEFLDEQLNEFLNTKEKRRKAANKRWSDASAMQVQCKSNAIREEKIREDKSKEEKIKPNILSLMSDANASGVTDFNKPYFEISKAFYDLFQNNAEKLEVKWSHLDKSKADKFIQPIRLLIESDKRTIEDLRLVWKFLQADEFWMPNIQSSAKLRKNFDQLITKAKQHGKENTANTYIESIRHTDLWKNA